jgi:hypothetical protein
VFNPLTPSELVAALSNLLREAGRSDGPRDAFEHAQLLAGYSIGKYLAAELAGGPAILAWFSAAVAEELEGKDAEQARSAADFAELGALLSRVLAELPADSPARTRLHALLRDLAEREIALLATAA